MSAVFSRTFKTNKVVIKEVATDTVLHMVEVDGQVKKGEIMEDFVSNIWDGETAWYLTVEEELEILEMDVETFKKHATALTGEKLEKRVAQIKKQQEKRNEK